MGNVCRNVSLLADGFVRSVRDDVAQNGSRRG